MVPPPLKVRVPLIGSSSESCDPCLTSNRILSIPKIASFLPESLLWICVINGFPMPVWHLEDILTAACCSIRACNIKYDLEIGLFWGHECVKICVFTSRRSGHWVASRMRPSRAWREFWRWPSSYSSLLASWDSDLHNLVTRGLCHRLSERTYQLKLL